MGLKGLYKKIGEKKLINNVYSKYWIYDLEDSIVQNETSKYRKLKVKFFDRSPKISDELTNLTLTINGSNITMKNIIRDGSCQNVKLMYCELQLDVDFVVNNIYISEYTLNQQKEQLSSQYYIKGIIYKGDEGRLNICKDLLGESNFVIAPEYNNMFWYCGCGYANMHNQHSCVRCNQSKEKMIKIADTNIEKLVFDNIKNSFNIDYKVPVETKLEQYVQDIANKYSVSKDLIMAQFNITELKRKQQELVDKTIVDYLNTNAIHFNYEKTFEENTDEYLSGIVKGIIYKNDVKQHLHMEQLANKYANGKKQYDDEKKKAANKKKIILVIGGIAAVAIVLLASIGLIKQQEYAKNNSAIGVEIKDTKENREILYEDILIGDSDVIVDYFTYDNSSISENIDKYFEENSIYSVNDLLYDQKVIASTKFLTTTPKETEIQEFGNKKFIAINKEQFIVQETVKVDDTTNKIYVYIGDKQGKPILGYYEETYWEQNISSETGQILEEVFYIDTKAEKLYKYQYEKGALSNIFVYDHPWYNEDYDYAEWYLSSETYFADGKASFIDTYDQDGAYLGGYVCQYEGDELVKIVYEDASYVKQEHCFDNGKLTKDIYEYDYGTKYEYTYYYSETGYITGYTLQIYNDGILSNQKLCRSYEFNECGFGIKTVFNLNLDGDYVLSTVYLVGIEKGMSPTSTFTISHGSDLSQELLNYHSDYHITLYDANVYYDLSTTITPTDDDLEQESYVLDLEQDYLFPGNRMLIQESDLEGLSELEVALIRNELYARHGYEFQTEPFKSYFNGKDWYRVNEDFNEIDDFNDIEIANRDFLIQYEIDKGWREE